VFFEFTDTGPPYRLALRLAVAAIASTAPQDNDVFALIRRADAESEAFAFTPLSNSPEAFTFGPLTSEHAQSTREFDRARAEQFVETVRRMGSQQQQ
jgi:hypothetical protein